MVYSGQPYWFQDLFEGFDIIIFEQWQTWEMLPALAETLYVVLTLIDCSLLEYEAKGSDAQAQREE